MKKHFTLAICLIIWVFVFLWFSEPFEIWRFTFSQKIVLLTIYSTFCGISYLSSLIYQNFRLKIYKNWRLIDEINLLSLAVFIAFILMYITYYFGVDHYNEPYSVFKYFRLIFLPATLIFLPFVAIGRIILGRAQLKSLVGKIDENELMVYGKGKYEYLKIRLEDLLYIKSLDNYIEVFYLEGTIVKRKTLRQNLTNLDLKTSNFLRIHRSFLINIKNVKECFFRNKNLVLVLKGDIEVPVSRSMKEEVLKLLPLTKN